MRWRPMRSLANFASQFVRTAPSVGMFSIICPRATGYHNGSPAVLPQSCDGYRIPSGIAPRMPPVRSVESLGERGMTWI